MNRLKRRKVVPMKARVEAAMRFMHLELHRIKQGHHYFKREYKPDSAETKAFVKMKLIELPAQGHLTATMIDVLQEILVHGNVPTKREAAEERAELNKELP